jgi:hypothetical protein
MADEPETSGQEPNLELPSFPGFGRRKKARKDGPAPGETAPAQRASQSTVEDTPGDTTDDAAAATAPEDTDPLAADPVAEPRGGLTSAGEEAGRLPTVPPPPVPPAEETPAERTQVIEPEPATGPAITPVVEPPAAVTPPPHERRPEPAATALVEPDAGRRDETAAAPGPATRTRLTLPGIDPRIATALTGALVGLLGVVLAFLTSRGCETVRGVGSCGGFGLLALLLIVAIEIVLGAALLKAWRIHDPVSTSLLGVGLVAVFVLLFLLSSLASVWTVLVVPVVSALAFVLSWWVTETFVEDSGT